MGGNEAPVHEKNIQASQKEGPRWLVDFKTHYVPVEVAVPATAPPCRNPLVNNGVETLSGCMQRLSREKRCLFQNKPTAHLKYYCLYIQ